MSPIAQRFEKVRQANRLALMPFLMAGDPDLETTAQVLLALPLHSALPLLAATAICVALPTGSID